MANWDDMPDLEIDHEALARKAGIIADKTATGALAGAKAVGGAVQKGVQAASAAGAKWEDMPGYDIDENALAKAAGQATAGVVKGVKELNSHKITLPYGKPAPTDLNSVETDSPEALRLGIRPPARTWAQHGQSAALGALGAAAPLSRTLAAGDALAAMSGVKDHDAHPIDPDNILESTGNRLSDLSAKARGVVSNFVSDPSKSMDLAKEAYNRRLKGYQYGQAREIEKDPVSSFVGGAGTAALTGPRSVAQAIVGGVLPALWNSSADYGKAVTGDTEEIKQAGKDAALGGGLGAAGMKAPLATGLVTMGAGAFGDSLGLSPGERAQLVMGGAVGAGFGAAHWGRRLGEKATGFREGAENEIMSKATAPFEKAEGQAVKEHGKAVDEWQTAKAADAEALVTDKAKAIKDFDKEIYNKYADRHNDAKKQFEKRLESESKALVEGQDAQIKDLAKRTEDATEQANKVSVDNWQNKVKKQEAEAQAIQEPASKSPAEVATAQTQQIRDLAARKIKAENASQKAFFENLDNKNRKLAEGKATEAGNQAAAQSKAGGASPEEIARSRKAAIDGMLGNKAQDNYGFLKAKDALGLTLTEDAKAGADALLPDYHARGIANLSEFKDGKGPVWDKLAAIYDAEHPPAGSPPPAREPKTSPTSRPGHAEAAYSKEPATQMHAPGWEELLLPPKKTPEDIIGPEAVAAIRGPRPTTEPQRATEPTTQVHSPGWEELLLPPKKTPEQVVGPKVVSEIRGTPESTVNPTTMEWYLNEFKRIGGPTTDQRSLDTWSRHDLADYMDKFPALKRAQIEAASRETGADKYNFGEFEKRFAAEPAPAGGTANGRAPRPGDAPAAPPKAKPYKDERPVPSNEHDEYAYYEMPLDENLPHTRPVDKHYVIRPDSPPEFKFDMPGDPRKDPAAFIKKETAVRNLGPALVKGALAGQGVKGTIRGLTKNPVAVANLGSAVETLMAIPKFGSKYGQMYANGITRNSAMTAWITKHLADKDPEFKAALQKAWKGE